jgi:hypothetical protein
VDPVGSRHGDLLGFHEDLSEPLADLLDHRGDLSDENKVFRTLGVLPLQQVLARTVFLDLMVLAVEVHLSDHTPDDNHQNISTDQADNLVEFHMVEDIPHPLLHNTVRAGIEGGSP